MEMIWEGVGGLGKCDYCLVWYLFFRGWMYRIKLEICNCRRSIISKICEFCAIIIKEY
jgi:hypothetical protein